MYDSIFEYVKQALADNDYATKNSPLPFRKRSEHIWRVYNWAKRLLKGNTFEIDINEESVLIAALFHDVGYCKPLEDTNHAENSEMVFRKYAYEMSIDAERVEFISFLIRNHSNKDLLNNASTPIELVVLIEADLLDELGALSILWDCMSEGGQSEQSYVNAYEHIKAYSSKITESNPMKTQKAKEIWKDKQKLVCEFVNHLVIDLALTEQ